MNHTKKYLDQIFRSGSFRSVLVLVALLIAGFFLGQFVGSLVAMAFAGPNFSDAIQLLSQPYETPQQWNALMATQIVTSLVIFVGVPLFYLYNIEKGNAGSFFKQYGKLPLSSALALTVLIMFLYMPISAATVNWNEGVKFPEFLQGVEKIAQQLEQAAREVTMFLIKFDNVWQLIIGIFAIAVLPGVGEELLFRGVLQNKLQLAFKNAHAAIWVSAIVFSLFHFQFYGFVPRMLLGALFGYLYIWSGNLLVPITAHFFNNGFTLVMMHLYSQELIETNIESTEDVPLTLVLGSLLLVGGGLYAFRQYHAHGRLGNPNL